MYIKFSAILLAVTAGLPLFGCGASDHKNGGSSAVSAIDATDSIPQTIKELVRAVADNDSDGFAKLVSYPLQRPYPLHDIDTPEAMSAYYRELVDDSLRNVIIKSGPDKWSEFGWRGWSLDDGRYVWVDENIYDVNYVSHAEQRHIDSLTRVEIAAIAPSIREGWRPVMCLQDTALTHVYRVDTRSSGDSSDHNHYRLAIYKSENDLKALPFQLLEGEMDIEGSAGSVIYRFHDNNDVLLFTLVPESAETASPSIISKNGEEQPLRRAYWHELIKK